MAKRKSKTKEATVTSPALDNVLSDITKKYGQGAIMHAEGTTIADVEFVATGIPGVDVALGCGGLPLGRIIEVYGPEASGKTTLALHFASEVQKAGGTVALIDAEHALDPKYARSIGVKMDTLLLTQPDSGEQALDITQMLVKSNSVDLIIVDSVAALVPKAELLGEIGDTHVGRQARMMSQALRILTADLSKSKCIVVFINQLRSKIGITFGNPETTTGGNALKFYASVRMDIRKQKTIKEGDKLIGTFTKVKVVKNKVAPPFKETSFQVYFGKGIDKMSSLLDLAVEGGVITISGSWYNYKDHKLGQGYTNACAYIKEHFELYSEIQQELYTLWDIPIIKYTYK